jgi:hypothetical protein
LAGKTPVIMTASPSDKAWLRRHAHTDLDNIASKTMLQQDEALGNEWTE